MIIIKYLSTDIIKILFLFTNGLTKFVLIVLNTSVWRSHSPTWDCSCSTLCLLHLSPTQSSSVEHFSHYILTVSFHHYIDYQTEKKMKNAYFLYTFLIRNRFHILYSNTSTQFHGEYKLVSTTFVEKQALLFLWS